MENAAKALLIAGGMFLVILIASLLTVFYNNISTYYAQEHELKMTEQAQKFNAKFENYHRNNIRGSDLISLMNKVIDYNATEVDGHGYDRIEVTITLGDDSILNQFKYETSDGTSPNQYLTTEEITNTSGNDRKLIEIVDTPSELCDPAKNGGIIGITDTKLQKLVNGIGNIMANESDMDTEAIYNRLKRAELIENILGLEISDNSAAYIKINKENGKTTNNIIYTDRMKYIKNITSQYYQYMQFKRAYFDCTKMEYDTKTNRVKKMNFKLQTKEVHGVTTVVFN